MTDIPTPAHLLGLIRQFRGGESEPGKDAIAGLLAKLEGEDSAGLLEAAQDLARIEPASEVAIALLRRRLDHADWDARFSAACGLGCFEPAFPILHAMLDDEDAQRRALGAVGTSCSPRAADAASDLIRLLEDPDAEVRLRAVDAIRSVADDAGVRASASVVPRLTALIQDADERISSRAIAALTAFGLAAPPAVPAIASLLRHPVYWVRCEAIGALADMDAEAVATAVPDLIPLLRSTLAEERSAAAEALGCIGPAAAASQDELARLGGEDPDEMVRAYALEALARIRNPGTIDE